MNKIIVESYEGQQKENYSNYLIFEDGNIWSKTSKKFLTPIKKSTGYYAVNLYSDDGVRKMFFVHRLVAEMFLANPHGYKQVNHKDENKANNAVTNLEWCNAKYNENFGTKKERELQTKTLTCKCNGRKRIGQYDINGILIREWDSLTEASDNLNISIGNISAAINGKRNHAGGYIWKVM